MFAKNDKNPLQLSDITKGQRKIPITTFLKLGLNVYNGLSIAL
jgi:hypothetical protein